MGVQAEIVQRVASGDLRGAQRLIEQALREEERARRVGRCPFVTVLRCAKDEAHDGLHRHSASTSRTEWVDPR